MTLIEVMVAILIFGFGMLGLAALQGAALKYQKNAWARGTIAALTDDIAERIRANRAAAQSGTYTYTATYATASTVSAPSCTTSATSSPQQVAACDLSNWEYAATQQLPGGAVNLSGTQATGFTVTIVWQDKDKDASASAATTCSSSLTSSQLRTCCPASLSLSSTTNQAAYCVNTVVFP